MGLTKFPNGISSMGMPVIGGGLITSGHVFFVHSGTGSDSNSGADTDHPLATIDAAINLCTADKGDIIIVMPGHAETVSTSAGFDADVAGISIVGLGNGDDRPTITFATSTGADVDLNADGVLVRNMKFSMDGVDALSAPIDVDGSNITIEDCEIIAASTAGQATTGLNLGVSSHGFTFQRNHVVAPNSGGTEFMTIAGVSNNVKIADNWFDGDWDTAAIVNTDGTNPNACLRMLVKDNVFKNDDTDAAGISLGTSGGGAAGLIVNNMFGLTGTLAGTLIGYGGVCRMFNNYIATLVTAQGELLPAVDGVATSDKRLKTQISYL